jgi:diguanylate cyclase (GGDEF)-like protein
MPMRQEEGGVHGRRGALVLLAATCAAGITVLASRPPLLHVWWVLAPGAAVAAVVVGVRRHRPDPAGPWGVLVGALTLLWTGWTMSAVLGADLAGPAARSAMTSARSLLYVIAYPMLGIAALMMVRARTGRRDRDDGIDALIVMVALATVLGSWLWDTDDIALVATDVDRLWVMASPLLLAAVVSASLRLLFAAGQRLPAAWLMFAGSIVVLCGNLWTSQLLREGLPTQTVGIDVLWVTGFVAIAAAALDPSMRQLTEPVSSSERLDGMPVDRLVLLGAALLAAPLAELRVAAGTPASWAVLVGGILTTLLVVWRVGRLLWQREATRAALNAAADRDAAVATIGRWALSDRSTPELLRDAAELIASTLPSTRCTIRPARGESSRDDEAALSFPIDDGQGRIAEVVAVPDPDRATVPGEREFLEGTAALLSSAARRRAAEARLRHDALHDALTGLPNRGLAVDRLGKLLDRRGQQEVALVFIDLDGFKAVNDTFGHAAGDEVLTDVAQRLRDCVRDGDTVARFAGDEFLVLAPDAGPAVVQRLVRRLSEAAAITIARDGVTLAVSGSMGVATGRSGTLDAGALLHLADSAMYRAKAGSAGSVAWSGTAQTPMEAQPR